MTLHRLKKYLKKKKSFFLKKKKRSNSLFLGVLVVVSFIYSPRSVLKIPAGVVEPVPACERQTRSTWRPWSDSGDVCRRFGYSLSRCSVPRRQVAWPAIHAYPNISGTYVHNLQRTTPTAFCRLWCAPCALFVCCHSPRGSSSSSGRAAAAVPFSFHKGETKTRLCPRLGSWLMLRSWRCGSFCLAALIG